MTSLEFAEAVRLLSGAARRAGWSVPSFRSRPRGSARRTIRRRADGSATVAVALRDRPLPAVVADLIDGLLVANGLTGEPALVLRDELWSVVGPVLVAPTEQPVDRPSTEPAGNVVAFAA